MARLEITLQNYRAFALDAPITFYIEEGISFFVGVNNVGKSALLRAFYELRPFVARDQLASSRRVQPHRKELNLAYRFDQIAHRKNPDKPIIIRLSEGNCRWTITITPRGNDPHISQYIVLTEHHGDDSENLLNFIDGMFNDSMYIGSFRSSSVQVSGATYDIQIGHPFIQQWDQWANGERIDHSAQVQNLTQELKKIFGFQTFQVSVAQGNNKLHLTTDDGRFSLDELGDGISHFFIVLGNAMVKQPSFIFIDEPEIGLHPKMQETFVRALAAKAKFGILATSHSIGLARSAGDKVFSVTRDVSGKRYCLPFGEHRENSLIQSISELSYSQYAELGANHLLLVEGRTEMKVFREILRMFSLDQHFLIWSLNGSDWIKADPLIIVDDLNEIKRLNPKSISVIVDSEKTSAKSELPTEINRFIELCRTLGFNTYSTDRHSTENYITQMALDELCPGEGLKALEPYEKFGDVGKKWPKSQNWRFFNKMSIDDFEGTGLKEFILATLKTLVDQTQ